MKKERSGSTFCTWQYHCAVRVLHAVPTRTMPSISHTHQGHNINARRACSHNSDGHYSHNSDGHCSHSDILRGVPMSQACGRFNGQGRPATVLYLHDAMQTRTSQFGSLPVLCAGDVEIGEGLVQQQQRGLARESNRDFELTLFAV